MTSEVKFKVQEVGPDKWYVRSVAQHENLWSLGVPSGKDFQQKSTHSEGIP